MLLRSDGREIVNGAINLIESEFVVPDPGTRDQFLRAHQHPLIDFLQFVAGHRIVRRIEIMNVAQHVAKRVAQFPIRLGKPRQDHRRNAAHLP